MKQIKEYLRNQKDLSLTMMSATLQEESINLVLVKHWLDRAVAVDQMLKELENDKN